MVSVEALRKTEERFRKIFEHSTDAILVIDPTQGRFVDANQKACRALGYAYDELMATPISTIHPHEMPAFKRFAFDVLEQGSGWSDEFTCTTKSGRTLSSEISAVGVDLDGRTVIIAMVRDITARKGAELALQRYAEDLEGLVGRANGRAQGRAGAATRAVAGQQRYREQPRSGITLRGNGGGATRRAAVRLRRPRSTGGPRSIHDLLVRRSAVARLFPVGAEVSPKKSMTAPNRGWSEEGHRGVPDRSVADEPRCHRRDLSGQLDTRSILGGRRGISHTDVGRQVALGVENMLAYEEIARLKERLEEENLYLHEELQTDHQLREIVGTVVGHPAGRQGGGNGRTNRRERAHHRRDRHRQGAHRAGRA